MKEYTENGYQEVYPKTTPQQAGALPSSGGTMTGPLILSGNPTQAMGAVTKQYVDEELFGYTQIFQKNYSDSIVGGRDGDRKNFSETIQMPLDVFSNYSKILIKIYDISASLYSIPASTTGNRGLGLMFLTYCNDNNLVALQQLSSNERQDVSINSLEFLYKKHQISTNNYIPDC